MLSLTSYFGHKNVINEMNCGRNNLTCFHIIQSINGLTQLLILPHTTYPPTHHAPFFFSTQLTKEMIYPNSLFSRISCHNTKKIIQQYFDARTVFNNTILTRV